MRLRMAVLVFACLWIAASICAAQDAKLAEATREAQKRIADSHAEVGIAFRTVDGKAEWFHNVHQVFHAASTMKVPVMIELFHQVKEGKVRLDEAMVVHNAFHSIVDGSPYTLDPADDSEAELYQAEGQTRTLSALCELMITVSSNFATNLLIERLGVENIRAEVAALGAPEMQVLRGVEDSKAYEKGLNNTTTACALETLMRAIAEGKAVDPEASRQMIAILEKQQFNEGIPAGLPAGTRVAHKTGEITKIHHDAAIVYAPRPFVLVILIRGMADRKDSAALMAEVTRLLYAATQ